MITSLMMILAYILPLPIMAACFYFHLFASIDDILTRLAAIGIVSVLPSAVLMIFVLKRILHLMFTVACLAAILFFLYQSGILAHFTAQ